MNNIPTANNYLKNSETYDKDYSTISLYDAEQRMKEFAKSHVKAALKAASEKAKITYVSQWSDDTCVDNRSILNAYPEENIK